MSQQQTAASPFSLWERGRGVRVAPTVTRAHCADDAALRTLSLELLRTASIPRVPPEDALLTNSCFLLLTGQAGVLY